MPVEKRSATASRFALTLDGVQTGFLQSVDGGGITAEVINESAGASYFVKKHIGQPKYEAFMADIDFSMESAIYDWISSAWAGNYKRINGSISTLDIKFDVIGEQEFFNALITETTIPACEALSKKPAFINVKFAPEYTGLKKGGDKVSITGSEKQKQWIPANFRLKIDGLDCTKVSKVDSFTVKQTIVSDEIGDARDYLKEPGKIEFPNLKITLPEVAVTSWFDWFDDFVVKGNNGDDKEKNGSLTFLAPNLKDELAAINFFNLGIFKLAVDKAEANSDKIKLVTAELYCERMEFQYG
jgi:hypothetical protein